VQHPAEHEFASQTHCPVAVSHSWPAAQAPQLAPLLPHWLLFSVPSGWHDVPVQQPEHDAPPQAQAPPVHACPDAHTVQAAPAVPHSELLCVA
jgi:hypothetical protein